MQTHPAGEHTSHAYPSVTNLWPRQTKQKNSIGPPSQLTFPLTSALPLLSQKKSQESINSRLALVMKSGKFTLGLKTTLKCLRSGKSELGVVRVVGGLRLLQSYFSPRRARRFAHLFSPLSPSLVPSLGKLIIVSSNIPPIRRAEIDYYAMLAKTAVHHYAGTNVELGTACGKLHRVAVLAITDPGDSDIIKLTPGAE